MTAPRGAMQEWRDGWKTVFAGFIGFLSFSVMISVMSAFMGPLAEEFGWSRTLLSSGTAISSIMMFFCAPFMGIVLDKYGARRMALPGIALSAALVAAMALNTGSQTLWIALWFIYAVVSLLVNTPVWTAAVAGLFDKSQGLAIAITLAGATAAHAIMPPIAVWLIDLVGWKMAFILLGGGWGLLSFAICYFWFFDAEDRKAAKAAKAEQKAAKRAEIDRSKLTGLSVSEAWRSRALWQIGLSILIIMLLTIGFLVHQIEILVGTGVDRATAGWLAGLGGGMGIVGKIITGALTDRYRGNLVGGLTMGAAAVAFALLLLDNPTTGIIIVAMLVNGYTAGAKLHIASFLTVRHAGMRNFGKIYGAISSLVALGSGLGPIVAGLVYDFSGSYTLFLTAGAVALAISALLLITLPGYPKFKEPEPEDVQQGAAELKAATA